MKILPLFLAATALGTMPMAAQQQQAAQSNRAAYDAFKKQAQKEYADFREKANAEYVEFIRTGWKEFQMQDGIPRPERFTVDPEVIVEDGDSVYCAPLSVIKKSANTASLESAISDFFGRVKRGVQKCMKRKKEPVQNKVVATVNVEPETTPPAPTPLLPEKENPMPLPQGEQAFGFYGKKYNVQRPADYQFTIGKLTNDHIAESWDWMTKKERFVPMLKDCLELRDSLQLNDWAYLQMLDSIGNAMYGDSNEGRLITGYLFVQSGYSLRLSQVNKRLGLMFPSTYKIYDRPLIRIENEDVTYYDYNTTRYPNLKVLPFHFYNEADIRLFYDRDQNLGLRPASERRIVSKIHPDMNVTVTVNKNLIDFYNTYPDGDNENNPLTRYAYHARVPLDSCVKASLYPALAAKIEGLSKVEAAQRLLNWVQTGFIYEYDEVVWGDDRAFFAEETLFYPYCDCEDRAIFYSRLVRDLIGLDVALVLYPNHLATAVNFADEDANVTGTSITIEGRRFVICDPTFIDGAKIGREMSSVDHSKRESILL